MLTKNFKGRGRNLGWGEGPNFDPENTHKLNNIGRQVNLVYFTTRRNV